MKRPRERPHHQHIETVVAIRQAIGRLNERTPTARTVSTDDLARLIQMARRIELAKRRGWARAAAQLAGRQWTEAQRVCHQLSHWIQERQSWQRHIKLPDASHLYRDLVALEAEFGEVDCDWGTTELFVTTEPIVLEDIELGRFEIRLNWSALDDVGKQYRIVACDPNPSAPKPSVTHPHVQDERLCPGDGYAAIAKALADRRLYDFFVIVQQILRTYSPGHAYVELDAWGGSHCRDCGGSLDEDSVYHCRGCESDVCESCVNLCEGCGSDFCTSCTATCAHCDNYRCSSCLSICKKCRAAVCSGCRQHETLCQNCHEQIQSDSPAPEPPVRPARGPLRASAAV